MHASPYRWAFDESFEAPEVEGIEMTKNLGLARYSTRGPMEYLLESGQWLLDTELYSGAPVLLFERKGEAQAHAKHQLLAADWGEFNVDSNGKVIASS